MYWLITQFPELDHLEPDERKVVLARIPWWTYPSIVLRSVISGLVFGGVVAVCVGRGLEARTLLLLWLTGAAAVATGVYLNCLRQVRGDMRGVIATAFRGSRPPFCMECGYDLRACKADKCPECGIKFSATTIIAKATGIPDHFE